MANNVVPTSTRTSSGRTRSWGARLVRLLRSRNAIVEDSSMEPEFLPGDRLRFEALRMGSPIEAGDIVVLADPDRSGRLLLKEVAATSGAVVVVTRSGVEVRQDPPPASGGDDLEIVRVPPDHAYVISRRPSGARDSRTFGPVPVSLVLGRVWYRYAPPERRGPIGGGAARKAPPKS